MCMFDVLFFCQPLFRAGRWTYSSVFRKITQKTGSRPARDAEMDRFRCHLAEVVALSSNGDCGATPLSVCLVATQLVTCTCGATCPRGFLSSPRKPHKNEENPQKSRSCLQGLCTFCNLEISRCFFVPRSPIFPPFAGGTGTTLFA